MRVEPVVTFLPSAESLLLLTKIGDYERFLPGLSNGVGEGGKVEPLHLDGRDQRGAAALAFGTANPFRSAQQLYVPGRQQFEHALIKSEIADRILDLSFFD